MSDDLVKRLAAWGGSAMLSKHFMGTVSAKETCAAAAAELTRLRAQVAGLTDAYWKLRSYAFHDDDCKLNKPPFKVGSCSCGLTKAITAGEEIAALSAYEGGKE